MHQTKVIVDNLVGSVRDSLKKIRGLPIIHTNSYVCGLPPGHRFQMRKFRGVYDCLAMDRIISPRRQVLEPYQIDRNLVELVHNKEYVENFFNGTTSKDEQRRTGFQWTHGLASRVRYECGGTLLGSLVALDRGLACSTGGGTHHAGPDYGSGYCLFNDLAISAAALLDSGLVSSVLVVDLDVHQGDGTALIFNNNSAVFTFSIHCQTNFPFRKQESDLDIGLLKHVEDKEYLTILSETLPNLLESFRPDLVLYDAGVDPHVDDDLGYLNLTDEGLMKRDQMVLDMCLSMGIPVCTVIGGGYHRDLDILSRRHSIVHRVADRVWSEKFGK